MTRRSRRSRWRRSRRWYVDDFDEMSVPKRYDNKPNLSIVHFVQKFRCQSFWAVCDAFNFNVTLRRATLYRASDRRSFREWRLEKFFLQKKLWRVTTTLMQQQQQFGHPTLTHKCRIINNIDPIELRYSVYVYVCVFVRSVRMRVRAESV